MVVVLMVLEGEGEMIVLGIWSSNTIMTVRDRGSLESLAFGFLSLKPRPFLSSYGLVGYVIHSPFLLTPLQ